MEEAPGDDAAEQCSRVGGAVYGRQVDPVAAGGGDDAAA